MTKSLPRHHKSRGNEHPGFSGDYRKLAETMRTWHGTAECFKYKQQQPEMLDSRWYTAVYGWQTVNMLMLIVDGIWSRRLQTWKVYYRSMYVSAVNCQHL